jgi:5-(aminomethyl)-3-furanmethanol phosphate kinase
MRALTVIKLGGSHAFAPYLRDWLDAIASCAGSIVLVPGGGPFADLVRDAQPRIGFDDDAAHHMALLAMEQYGCALASLNAQLALAESKAEIAHALAECRVPVWLPSRMVLAAREIPWSWDVTSDSLAAWLGGELSASRLVLVKHEAAHMDAEELAARGIVDSGFPRFLARSGVPVAVLGAADHARLAAREFA